jgi:hypothetical protein
MPKAGDQAKELATKLAKETVKKAVMQATASTAAVVAPYVGIGCLVILGIFLAIFIFSTLSYITLYKICEDTPRVLTWAASWWYSLPDFCAKILK